MNDVVERVARILIDHDSVFSGHCEEHLAVFRPRARAVIEAMREPSDAMLRAAHDGPLSAGDHEMSDAVRKWLTEIWSAMLSTALADASPDIGKEGIGNDVR